MCTNARARAQRPSVRTSSLFNRQSSRKSKPPDSTTSTTTSPYANVCHPYYTPAHMCTYTHDKHGLVLPLSLVHVPYVIRTYGLFLILASLHSLVDIPATAQGHMPIDVSLRHLESGQQGRVHRFHRVSQSTLGCEYIDWAPCAPFRFSRNSADSIHDLGRFGLGYAFISSRCRISYAKLPNLHKTRPFLSSPAILGPCFMTSTSRRHPISILRERFVLGCSHRRHTRLTSWHQKSTQYFLLHVAQKGKH